MGKASQCLVGSSKPKASNPDTLPTPGDPTGPCPWCGRVSNFQVQSNGILSFRSNPLGATADRKLATLTCLGCNKGTAVVTANDPTDGLMWWPAPGMGILDKQVDAGVASAYDEGMRCLSIGANRAAAVMFRSSLSLFVKDKGSEKAKKERHLKNALKHMKDDGDLHKSLWDWADHLNQLGNEGAHPEDYDDVTADEAEGLGKFVRHLIRHEYEMPAQLLRDQGLLNDDDPEDESGPNNEETPAPIIM
ncbi:DUF4145 domain-containing protein [Nocardioides sp. YJ-D4]